MRKLFLIPAVLAALAFGGTYAYASRPGIPSGVNAPIVDSDDVIGTQPPSRSAAANTALTYADHNRCLVITSAATVAIAAAATLGDGFYGCVIANGATATVTAASNTWTVTTGKLLRVWVAGATPTHFILVSTFTAHD